MKGLGRSRLRLVVLSLSLMVVFGLLINGNEVQAQDNLKFVTLFQGQRASVSFSQVTPFGMSTVFVTSIGNRTLSAGLTGESTINGDQEDAKGFWLVSLFGTGGANYAGFAGGFVPLSSGQKALIDIGPQVSFGWATASIFLTSLGVDGNFGYKIDVAP